MKDNFTHVYKRDTIWRQCLISIRN